MIYTNISTLNTSEQPKKVKKIAVDQTPPTSSGGQSPKLYYGRRAGGAPAALEIKREYMKERMIYSRRIETIFLECNAH